MTLKESYKINGRGMNLVENLNYFDNGWSIDYGTDGVGMDLIQA